MKCEVVFPTPLPDDPQKWDGWNKYKSTNPYERLCLDAQQNPTNELIEEHCRELLRWWQKKLPLKNQPSNPVAQLLRAGLDESSRYLTEARMELLDPERRKKVDAVLAAEAEQQAIAEFNKVLVLLHRGWRASAGRGESSPAFWCGARSLGRKSPRIHRSEIKGNGYNSDRSRAGSKGGNHGGSRTGGHQIGIPTGIAA